MKKITSSSAPDDPRPSFKPLILALGKHREYFPAAVFAPPFDKGRGGEPSENASRLESTLLKRGWHRMADVDHEFPQPDPHWDVSLWPDRACQIDHKGGPFYSHGSTVSPAWAEAAWRQELVLGVYLPEPVPLITVLDLGRALERETGLVITMPLASA